MKNALADRLGLRLDANFGCRELRGKEFKGQSFPDLVFGPIFADRMPVFVQDCQFIECDVGGGFRIDSGCAFCRVTFDSIGASHLKIYPDNVLNEIVIRGIHQRITISDRDIPLPEGTSLDWVNELKKQYPTSIDISEVQCQELKIYNIDFSVITRNPDEQIIISKIGLEKIKENESQQYKKMMSIFYWKHYFGLLHLRKFKREEGLHCLPPKRDKKKYAEVSEFLPLLREYGAVR